MDFTKFVRKVPKRRNLYNFDDDYKDHLIDHNKYVSVADYIIATIDNHLEYGIPSVYAHTDGQLSVSDYIADMLADMTWNIYYVLFDLYEVIIKINDDRNNKFKELYNFDIRNILYDNMFKCYETIENEIPDELQELNMDKLLKYGDIGLTILKHMIKSSKYDKRFEELLIKYYDDGNRVVKYLNEIIKLIKERQQ